LSPASDVKSKMFACPQYEGIQERGPAPLILSLAGRWMWEFGFMTRPLFSREIISVTIKYEYFEYQSWYGFSVQETNLCHLPESEPWIIQPVAWSLCRLLLSAIYFTKRSEFVWKHCLLSSLQGNIFCANFPKYNQLKKSY